MANVNTNEVINGLYGFVYDENGKELDTTQEFEFSDQYTKVEIDLPGEFYTKHKVMGGKLAGKVRFLKVDSDLQAKLKADPTAKFNYIGKLADPNARGQEAVVIRGLSFDANPIIGWTLKENVEVDVNFTADDWDYLDTIAG